MWFCLACIPLLLVRKAPDLYVSQTNPPLVIPLVALAALVHRKPFVIIAQDIYPEVMFAHGMTNPDGVWGRALSATFGWAYRRAAMVVALGDVMAQRLSGKGVRGGQIAVIPNWATGELSIDRSDSNQLSRDWGLTGKYVILYSGNVGVSHDLETPIAALRMLMKVSTDIRFVIVGKGSRLADVKRKAMEAGVLHAVQFRALVPGDQLPQTFGIANVALVTLRPGFDGLVVPSKLMGYMARGVPTIYVGPYSDVEQVLTESGGGMCVRNGDAEGLCRVILTLIANPERSAEMGAAAANYYATHLTRNRGLEKYANVVARVLTKASGPRC